MAEVSIRFQLLRAAVGAEDYLVWHGEITSDAR